MKTPASNTADSFRPWEVHDNPFVGRCITMNNAHARLPRDMLPTRLTIDSTYVSVGGARVLDYFFGFSDDVAGDGLICFPTIIGDGSENLEQCQQWAKLNGYTCEDPDNPFECFILSETKNGETA